jgi:Family of unknown function (DUF5906)/Bifunctional DNA primase/polymerase, N-terminal
MVANTPASSPETIQTLNWLDRCNYRAVPLTFREKTLADKNGYQSDYLADRNQWFNSKLNIGLLTGPIRKGPLDIDLDCHEAARLAPYFLPQTKAIFGRASNPKSHYLYEVDVTEFSHLTFVDPSGTINLIGKSNILEIRGDNTHTMLPGSIHPNGEMVEWSDDKNPSVTKIKANDLISACKLLTAAVLCAKYIWLDGQRHETALQLGGIFQRVGKSEEEATNFIEALISFSGRDDPAHIKSVISSYRKAANNKPVKSTKSFLDRFKDHNPQMARKVLDLLGFADLWLDDFNSKYACVLVNQKYRIVKIAQHSNEAHQFLMQEDFKGLTNGQVIIVDLGKGKTKTYNASELWLRNQRRRQYEKVQFLPGQDDEAIKDDTLNKFTGWAINPIDNPSKCQAFRTLIEKYIADPDKPIEAQWLYTFFAHILREPMDKLRAAVVIIGPQNIGKSVFVNYFGKILGRHHLNVADASRIHGRFNGHLEQCLLLHSEEAIYGKEKKHKSIIKDLIANKMLTFEEKYLGVWQAPSYTRLIYTSNMDNAAPLEIKDTRHSVFNLNHNKRVPPRILIKQLYEESITDGPQALMHYLLNYKDYDKELLFTSLNTKAKSLAVIETLDPIDDYFVNKLMEGNLLPNELRWAQGLPKENKELNKLINWPCVISRLAIYADYMQFTYKLRRTPISSYAFFKRLAEVMEIKFNFRNKLYMNPFSGDMSAPMWLREIYSGVHQTILNFPTLKECRTAFEAYTGQTYDWPKEIIKEEITEDDIPENLANEPAY